MALHLFSRLSLPILILIVFLSTSVFVVVAILPSFSSAFYLSFASPIRHFSLIVLLLFALILFLLFFTFSASLWCGNVLFHCNPLALSSFSKWPEKGKICGQSSRELIKPPILCWFVQMRKMESHFLFLFRIQFEFFFFFSHVISFRIIYFLIFVGCSDLEVHRLHFYAALLSTSVTSDALSNRWFFFQLLFHVAWFVLHIFFLLL